MVLESLNNLNIKRMVLETPEKSEELPFDVEKDITREDWDGMRQELEKSRGVGWDSFASHAMRMKFLDPNIDLNLDDNAWHWIEKVLEEYRHNDEWFNFAWHAKNMKILNPSVNLNLDNIAWQGLKLQLKESESNFSRQATCIKILYPAIDLGIDDAVLQKMEQRLEGYKHNNGWGNFAWRAMNMKILNPNIDLSLDDTTWAGMKEELERCRKNTLESQYRFFASHAMAMKVLAAEEVRITNKGIELIMPKPKIKPAKDIPPMPEVKKF